MDNFAHCTLCTLYSILHSSHHLKFLLLVSGVEQLGELLQVAGVVQLYLGPALEHVLQLINYLSTLNSDGKTRGH